MSNVQPASSSTAPPTCTAFLGMENVASGDVPTVVRQIKTNLSDRDQACVLIFDDHTSRIVEVDFRGTVEEALGRLDLPEAPSRQEEEEAEEAPRGRGRPKLGVVAREVTLLPRHWDWLGEQRGGASAALRRLVERASRENRAADERRRVREAAYKFMSAIGGDLPGFEEASRALFAGEGERFRSDIQSWPVGVRDHLLRLVSRAFGSSPSEAV